MEQELKGTIDRLKECIRSHMNPYNLGDEGETTRLIYQLIKQVESPTVQPTETVFIPCAGNDHRAVGGYTSYDGQSLCYVREVNLSPDQSGKEGAVQPNKEEAAALIQWGFGNIRSWNKSTGQVILYDGSVVNEDQLYTLYQQSLSDKK